MSIFPQKLFRQNHYDYEYYDYYCYYYYYHYC